MMKDATPLMVAFMRKDGLWIFEFYSDKLKMKVDKQENKAGIILVEVLIAVL